ncbi:hydantoinase/oxoprolinase family protein [Oceanicella sp. SM1341]|uniref:hydantoinase/oxoprolinase family protein n=1 Tax=Oceanicella sp. SM1341 TaxID=1548889 RepID=UPI000E51B6C5|nr:hydantoinase/oxoprolinase family protein [Oceanicella sp. SM1341]
MSDWAIGIDTGGTYLDLVALGPGARRLSAKAPLGPDRSAAVLAALREFLDQAGIAPAAVGRVVHGTTLVTNLLLEQGAPPVAVVTNRGFEDVLAIGRQSRRDLYAFRPRGEAPERIFPEALRHGISGRLDARGQELTPLDAQELATLGARLAREGVAAAAVCLLHAVRNPAHERAVRAALLDTCPDLAISLSHEVSALPGEAERFLATALDAYVKPALSHYLLDLGAGLGALGLPQPELVTSDATLAEGIEAVRRPLRLAMSGPASALRGFALAAGPAPVVSIETGGTTTDIGLIEAGAPLFTRKLDLGAFSLATHAADVASVAVGGGSVAAVNAGGALRLGPRSAGAVPGPAAMGRGGVEPTLTDALMLLDRLPMQLAGGLRLNRLAAERAMLPLARALACTPRAAAEAVLAAATAAIAEAVKLHAFRRGIDPASASLLAGGGGGPQHAAEVAAAAGFREAIVLPDAGVISALGGLASSTVDVAECAPDLPLDPAHFPALRAAAAALPPAGPGAQSWTAGVLYEGQAEPLALPFAPEADDACALAARFDALHARLRGHALDLPRRVAWLRRSRDRGDAPLGAAGPAPAWELPGEGPLPARGAGPRALFAAQTTIWVPEGWSWRLGAAGALHLAPGAAA